MAEPTYLDLLRADLRDYVARTKRALELRDEQPEGSEDARYYTIVLAQLERGRSIVEAKIAREEAACAQTVQP